MAVVSAIGLHADTMMSEVCGTRSTASRDSVSEVTSVDIVENSELRDLEEADSDSDATGTDGTTQSRSQSAATFSQDVDDDASKKSKKKSVTKKSSSAKKKKKVKKKKGTSFVVDFTNDSKDVSLQQAFKKYKKSKQDGWKEERKLKELNLIKRSDPERMEELRMKFVERAKKYFGVPYKRKYWPEDAPEYKSPIFLDCCGLVRRVMWDLKYDFGFKLGPWNQAYMYDTLPNTIRKEEDMKPGDLVFISAIYNNPKAKKQRHNMVHVEIWLGDGPKTIGARWQKGKVQVFDSYKFNATSYHSPKYILKSLDTWLKGICQSYCDVHPWYRKAKMYAPSVKSVFAKHESDTQQADDDDCLDANDTDDELIMTPDDPEELRKKLRDCMLDEEIDIDEDQDQELGEDVEDEIQIGNFGASIASAGLGRNQKNGHGTNGAVKLSSSPEHEKYLRSTTGDAMEVAAAAVDVMAKGGVGGDGGKDNASKKQESSSSDTGPIKLKMTTSHPLQPAGKGPEKHVPAKESPRRNSVPVQPVHKSAPAAVNRSQPGSPKRGSVVDYTSPYAQNSAPAARRGSDTKGTSPPRPQPPNAQKLDTQKQNNKTGKNQNNNANAKESAMSEQKSPSKVEPVKQAVPKQRPTKDSNLKSESSSSINQKVGAQSPTSPKVSPPGALRQKPTKTDSNLKSESSSSVNQKVGVLSPTNAKVSPPGAQASKQPSASQGAKVPSQKPGDSAKSPPTQKAGGASKSAPSGQTRQGQTPPGNSADVKTSQGNNTVGNKPVPGNSADVKTSQGNNAVGNKPAVGYKAPVSPPFKSSQSEGKTQGTPRPEWKPAGAIGNEDEEGNRRQSETPTTTPRKASESGPSKSSSSPSKPKPQNETDKKTEKRDSIKSPNNTQDTSTEASPTKPKRLPPPIVSLSNNLTPLYYIGGGNGVAIVDGFLANLGWKRTMDKTVENWRLKWTECKSQINYTIFKEGEQMVNHIPNCNLMTNKLGLLNSLKEYERICANMKKARPPRFKMTDIVPETYNLDERNDREIFFETYKEGEMWICKPTGLNQGKGIFIVREIEDVHKFLGEREEKFANSKRTQRPMPRIIQRYLKDPLLIHGRKFDIRSYMLIASTVPFIVFYHDGYIRLSCHKYCKESMDLTTHLTNQFVQKKDPLYKDNKEDTVLSMELFNDYINERIMEQKGLEKDWVKNTCVKQMQRIMLHLFNSVRHKLTSKVGFFELYGLDFMIDADMKVWLIEVNINPSLHVNTEILKEVVPPIVEESLAISVEVFEKSRKGQAIYPIRNIKSFTYLFCGVDHRSSPQRESENRRHGGSPARARSASPIKDEWIPRGRSNANGSPYAQPLNLPKISARYKMSESSTSAKGVRTSATVTSTVTEPMKLKVTHSEGRLTDKADVKGEQPNRGN